MTPRRIKLGLIIGLSLLLFFGFFIINVVNYEVAKNSIRRGILNATLPLVSDNLYSEIQADLISPVEVSAMMANDTFLKDWILSGEKDIDLITKYLLAINKRYGYVSTFFVSERTGRYYHYKGLQKTISPEDEHDVWYYRFKKINVDYELDVDTDEAAKGRLTVFINHRLTDSEGNFLGITGVGIAMDQIGALLKKYQDRYQTNVFMVNKDLLIMIHPDRALIEKNTVFDMLGFEHEKEEFFKKAKPYATTEYDHEGRHFIISARYIPEFKWYLIVEQVEDTVLADIRMNFIRNVTIGIVVTIMIIFVNILLVNFFQGKLENMTGELIEKNRDLEKALKEVKRLSGLLPICAHCKKIRDDKGYWKQIEIYIQEHSEADFSHGICPDCAKKLYPGMKLSK